MLRILLFGVFVALLAPSAAAAAKSSFFGVVPQAPLKATDLERIGGLGLRIRLPVYWFQVETSPGVYDFSALDAQIGAAADHGIQALLELGGSPPWVGPSPATPPLAAGALGQWRAFVAAMVGRYGTRGTFWEGRARRVPVRLWQVWNEPNFPVFWAPQPSPRGYARLLHASAATVRAADPGARVVAAGLAPISGEISPWGFLRRLYRVPGFKQDADFVALHPYATTLARLEEEVAATHRVMEEAGDSRKPLLLTELGVASHSQVPTGYNRGPEGQARFLENTYARLLSMRRRWHIAGAYWFTWQDTAAPDPNCIFCEGAGLFDGAGRAKPAWAALKRSVAMAARNPVR